MTDKITFVGGTVFSTTVLSKIRHIEVRVEIPIGHVESLADLENISVFRLDEVMFVRPRSQALVAFGEADERADEPEARPAEPKRTSPRIALLDGVPVQNHPLLAGHIDLDDPDGFEESAALPERVHGTAMLSLILHGDLSENNAVLDERIYTRPILLPRQTLHASIEEIPEHSIPSDVLQRSIVRMLGPRGVARDVRVVCLCVADSQRPVDATLSPWARLIDSLSWEYGLLFVLAAGNYSSDLILPIRSTEFHGVPQKDADDTFLGAVVESVSKRPILSPSEAINAITVGASSAGGADAPPGVFVPFEADGAERPSSFSATGGGVGRTIKPDIFLPGGRQAFRLSPLSPAHQSVLRPISARQLPGHEVASPPRSRGHIKGTSNSAALATRSCAEILDALSPIFENAGLSRHEEIAILKALLTHSASWGGAKALIGRYVQTRVPAQLIRNEIARIIGYGFARPEKVVECTRSRVTVIASGKVKENRGIVFRFPLPPSLASRRLQRTLTTTLAFLTPVSVAGRVYRTHNLWLSNTFRGQGLDHSLQMRTIEAHEPLVARGTVQHLIYSGESAVPFVDGDQLEIQVNCKRDSGSRLVTGIPFGVAATLEVHENLGIDLYEEVRMRIAVPAAVQVGIAEIIL